MPFNCDICGDECGYESRILTLYQTAQKVVVCDNCMKSDELIEIKQKMKEFLEEFF